MKKRKICYCAAIGLLLLISSTACGHNEDDIGELGTLDSALFESGGENESAATPSNVILDSNGNPMTDAAGETMTIPASAIEETTREPSEELPEVAIYDKTVLPGYSLEINKALRYTMNYPEGYSVSPADKYKTFLVKDDTQLFVYCINSEFEDSESVYYSGQISDELYRFPYTLDGKAYTATVMDRGKHEKKEVNGKTVIRETPMIEFVSDDITSFIKPTCVSYFTDYDGRGFAIIAVSTDKTTEELDKTLSDMMSTLGTYVPAKSEAKYETGSSLFVAKDKTGNDFPYPDGWQKSTENGFVIFTPPDDASLYAGAMIIYKSDEKHELVEDSAQFAGITDALAPIFMQAGYDKEQLGTNFVVNSMDDNVSLDGVPCILFEVTDLLQPYTKAVELLLPSSGEEVHSYRYTFDSNGIPCMVSFVYASGNKYQVRDMADDIMSKINVK